MCSSLLHIVDIFIAIKNSRQPHLKSVGVVVSCAVRI